MDCLLDHVVEFAQSACVVEFAEAGAEEAEVEGELLEAAPAEGGVGGCFEASPELALAELFADGVDEPGDDSLDGFLVENGGDGGLEVADVDYEREEST